MRLREIDPFKAGFPHLFPAASSGYRIVRLNSTHEFSVGSRFRRAICLLRGAIALLFFCVHTLLFAQGNSWTKPTSGYWEEPFWSLGELPARGQGLIAFQNPGWKALAISQSTTLNHSNSLAIDALAIEGPTNTMNQLLLNYPGLDVPLTVDGLLRLGTNASIVGYNSAVQAGDFHLSSPAAFTGSSVFVSSNILVGVAAMAQLSLTNSSCTASVVRLQNGELLLNSGYLQVGQMLLAAGTYRQNGGTARITTLGHYYPLTSDSFLYLSSGTLISETMNLGRYDLSGFSRAYFTQSGGVHSNSSLSINGGQRHFQLITHVGNYTLNGGLLVSSGTTVFAGTFNQTGGTNYAGELGVSAGGYYVLAGGRLVTSNTTVSSVDCLQDVFVQSGGAHVVQNTLKLDRAVNYNLANGSLTAPFIGMDGQAVLNLQPGVIFSNSGSIMLGAAGISVASGTQQFGKLQVVPSSSYFSCSSPNPPTTAVLYAGGTASAAVLRFADSRDVPWSSTLKIMNWSTNNAGSGPDHIYFGTNSQALTVEQLTRILFVRPDDPSSDYSAVILANGEVVPGAPLNFTSTVTNGTVTITGYTGPGGAVNIPAMINGLPVTGIGASAFYGRYDITSVTIPDTITSIGSQAFAYCKGLTTLTVPNSVKMIGDQAFYVCEGLTNIFLGNGLTAIGFAALRYCPNLVGVYFAGDAPAFGDYFDFYNSDQVVVYYLPGTIGWGSTLADHPTALWFRPNPVLLNFGPSFGFQSNRFGFVVSWATNRPVVVEAKAGLGNGAWLPVSTNSLSGGSVYFNDPQTQSNPSRLYRVRAQ